MDLRLTIGTCQGNSRREDYRNNPNNLNLIPTQFLGTLLGQKRILFDSGNESS
jgi:hypothetical protein